jgi:hypothetical protein
MAASKKQVIIRGTEEGKRLCDATLGRLRAITRDNPAGGRNYVR